MSQCEHSQPQSVLLKQGQTCPKRRLQPSPSQTHLREAFGLRGQVFQSLGLELGRYGFEGLGSICCPYSDGYRYTTMRWSGRGSGKGTMLQLLTRKLSTLNPKPSLTVGFKGASWVASTGTSEL